ncbi:MULTISPECIES: DJ-1/PfpI family protein [unclassified Breznakia]|uniref:DJ-1/PfpI family protein n=1 Tax=unclassified Breznakia TaxID=2623764 RepID=UPI0024748398|nr:MULTISPECIES: DJ-1/PfpI family protein [unclassified Breznakia]MDH6368205.1 putative intracellular protease/amidase [Breznakia sp. PH1-1]MDH6405295.1 putative intracellular protease/amidase [Breznakia sp. PF1-11]MDH6413007.1 putative intracellular protease/amidase [Breznakia sp. PFB1-11]MDH6415367.1 putative intracellular protease/amidase [Breznakia sp. PFB1-14]MDH6417674.1 putative intracellular protease/amidase [Breznakia sp. PFB1-4]
MNKRIALLVYPAFSMQEISNLSYVLRWNSDTFTDIIATSKEVVTSEEGIQVMPNKTVDEFSVNDYDCLVLSGCSDFRIALRDQKLKAFLESLKDTQDFLIGAICAGPVFLAQAGLLKGKKYTDSLFAEMHELLPFIEADNFVAAPVVEDGNIVTANGSAFNAFAVHIARRLGYILPDKIMSGYIDDYKEEDYVHHLPEEGLKEFIEEFADIIESKSI